MLSKVYFGQYTVRPMIFILQGSNWLKSLICKSLFTFWPLKWVREITPLQFFDIMCILTQGFRKTQKNWKKLGRWPSKQPFCENVNKRDTATWCHISKIFTKNQSWFLTYSIIPQNMTYVFQTIPELQQILSLENTYTKRPFYATKSNNWF